MRAQDGQSFRLALRPIVAPTNEKPQNEQVIVFAPSGEREGGHRDENDCKSPVIDRSGFGMTARPLSAIAPAMTAVSPAATCTAISAKKSGASEGRGKPTMVVGLPIIAGARAHGVLGKGRQLGPSLERKCSFQIKLGAGGDEYFDHFLLLALARLERQIRHLIECRYGNRFAKQTARFRDQ